MTDEEAVRETKNFIKAQAKANGIDTAELMQEVEEEIEEEENGG